MNVHVDSIIAEVVLDHPETATAFQARAIDYCCRGRRSIRAACEGRPDITAGELTLEVRRAVRARRLRAPSARAADPRSLSTAALIARIVDEHHGYTRRAMAELLPLAHKVAGAHGLDDARLIELAGVLGELFATLESHLDHEESVLFPMLMSSRPAVRDGARRELCGMFDEHVAVGLALERVRALTDGYVAPPSACPTYRVFLDGLERLEADIHRHVHLENNVLAAGVG